MLNETFTNYLAGLEANADLAFQNACAATANDLPTTADAYWQELQSLRTEIRHAKKLGNALGLVGA